MSQKQHRTLRVAADLAGQAHHAVHLLLELSEAITDPAVAAVCANQAELLGRAVRRVAPLVTKKRDHSVTSPGFQR